MLLSPFHFRAAGDAALRQTAAELPRWHLNRLSSLAPSVQSALLCLQESSIVGRSTILLMRRVYLCGHRAGSWLLASHIIWSKLLGHSHLHTLSNSHSHSSASKGIVSYIDLLSSWQGVPNWAVARLLRDLNKLWSSLPEPNHLTWPQLPSHATPSTVWKLA